MDYLKGKGSTSCCCKFDYYNPLLIWDRFGLPLETRFNQLLSQWAGVSVACTAFYLSCLPCLLPSFCLCVCSLFLFWSQWFYLNIRGCLKIILGAVAAFSTILQKIFWRNCGKGSYIRYKHHHNLIQKMLLIIKKCF